MGTELGEECVEEKRNTHLGPYRATKLWNDVLRSFRDNLPIGRHRRYMKSYDACFVASEAISWLHTHLRNDPNFGPGVTRHQTILLLQKFHKALVFEDVRAATGDEEFSDNGRLYRFIPESPVKPARCLSRTPLAQRTSLLNKTPAVPPYSLTMKKEEKIKKASPDSVGMTTDDDDGGFQQPADVLTADETEQVWRTLTLNRLQELLSLDSIQDILEPDFIETSHIVHNMTQINKNGIVSNIDKQDQLPHWVLSAMRCLAYWPERVDNYPDYPGFERDVFRVVKDYFESLPEPLTTFPMYEVFMNVMVAAEGGSSSTNRPPSAHQGQHPVVEPPPKPPRLYLSDNDALAATPAPQSQPHVTSFASVENLMLNLTMNGCHGNVPGDQTPPQEIMIVHDDGREEVNRSLPRATAAPPPVPVRRSRTLPRHTSCGARMETMFGVQSARGGTSPGNVPASPIPYIDDPGYCSNSEGSTNSYVHHRQQHNTSSKVPNGYTIGYAKSSLTLHDLYSEDNRYRDLTERCLSMADMHKSDVQIPENNLSQCSGQRTSVLSGNINNSSSQRKDNSAHYGYTVVLSTTPKTDSDEGRVIHRDPIVRNDPDYYEGAGFRPRSNCSLRPENPPPYKPPPSYNQALYSSTRSSSSNRSHVSDGTRRRQSDSDASFVSARSHLSSCDPAAGRSWSVARPSGSVLRQKSATNLTESYRMAVEGPAMYATPVSRGLFSSHPALRKCESSPNLAPFKPSIEERVEASLQLCLLLMPPASRRKLHLLLRLMHKMVHNPSIKLSESMDTRKLLLQTFSRAILRPQEEADLDEVLTAHAVSFMVDHYQNIMKVPTSLRRSIETKLNSLRRAKPACFLAGVFPPPHSSNYQQQQQQQRGGSDDLPADTASAVTFCSQVSRSEFEAQAVTASHAALAQLLNNIVADASMSVKDKKRRLKQFQKNHPDIYRMRFPTSAHEAELFPNKPRIKPPLLTKPLQRLKNLRL